jgi:hypothetical protein
MRSRFWLLLLSAPLAIGVVPQSAHAQKKPVQLSLVTPVQIFPPEDTIGGVRLNLLYGRNAVVNGLDVGLINRTTEISRGVQFGVVGLAEDFQGIQYHAVSIANGKFEGWQLGYVNVSEVFRGFQAGLVNYSVEAEGFQLSLVNYAHSFTGLQVGLVNIIREGGMLPFFPIFNIGS